MMISQNINMYFTKECKGIGVVAIKHVKSVDLAIIVSIVCTKTSLVSIDMNVKIKEITLEENNEETCDYNND